MAFYKGNTRIGAIFKGNKYIGEIYKGNTKIEEFGYDKTQTGTLPMTLSWVRPGNATFELEGNSSGVTGIGTRRNKHAEVPLEYTELQYIISSQGCYIDSGVKAASDTRIEMKVMSTDGTVNNVAFGARSSTSSTGDARRFIVWSNYGTGTTRNKMRFDYGGQSSTESTRTYPANNEYVIVKSGRYNEISGVDEKSNSAYTSTWGTPDRTIHLCGCNDAGTHAWNFYGRIYYCKMYKTVSSVLTLIRDFYPVKRNSDGAIGLYDYINNEFYVSPAADGQFTAGPTDIYYGQELVVTSGSQTSTLQITAPRPLNKIEDKADVLTSTYALYNIGIIESYNGEEVGSKWVSSTGALDIGAYVIYQLSVPEVPILLPTQTLTLFGDTNTISMTGDIQPSSFKINYKSKLNI